MKLGLGRQLLPHYPALGLEIRFQRRPYCRVPTQTVTQLKRLSQVNLLRFYRMVNRNCFVTQARDKYIYPQSSRYAKAAEFEFSSVGFNLKMAPGDFLLLGPAEHTGQGVGLADYFFTRQTPSRRPFLVRSSDDSDAWRLYSGPVVRICLFICTTINY